MTDDGKFKPIGLTRDMAGFSVKLFRRKSRSQGTKDVTVHGEEPKKFVHVCKRRMEQT